MSGLSDADKDRAGDLMDEGDVLFERSAFPDALQKYEQADAIMNVPVTGLAIARVLEKLGRLTEARAKAVAVASMPVEADEPAPFVRARAEAAALSESLRRRIPTLILEGLPTKGVVRVEVDGKAVADPRVPIMLDPGSHAVRVAVEGREEQLHQVTLSEGARERLGVSSSEGTTSRDETGEADQDARVPTLAYVGFGIGAVGIAVGSVTGYMTWSKSKELEDSCGGTVCSPSYQDDIDSGRRSAMISNIAFGIGAVGVGVGVVALLTGESDASARETGGLRLGVMPGGAVLSGQFR
jgi:hypothetical protein